MKFTWFNLMRCPSCRMISEKNRSSGRYHSRLFDPQGARVYNTYLDLLEYAADVASMRSAATSNHQNATLMPSPNIIAPRSPGAPRCRLVVPRNSIDFIIRRARARSSPCSMHLGRAADPGFPVALDGYQFCYGRSPR